MFRRAPPRRSRVTHMEREEGVPLDGAWNMHEDSMRRVRGSREARDACAWRAAWRVRSCLGEGDPLSVGGGRSSLTFMILSRSSKKRWGLSGFVK